MTDVLKPCPFCGGVAVLQYTDDNNSRPFVQCKFGTMRTPKCPASRLYLWDYLTVEEAVEAWNRRKDD